MDSNQFDRALSVVLTVAVLVGVGFLVEGRINQSTRGDGSRVVQLKDWSERSTKSLMPLDNDSAAVNIVVFTDFECPFCAAMDSSLEALRSQLPGKISRSIVHLPLQMHRNAIPAATAFNCSAAQGRAEAMHRALYRNQDSLGLVPWSEFARQASVTDIKRFDSCIEDDTTNRSINAGIELAKSLEINRTPVVVVNGWLLDPAHPQTVEEVVNTILAGRTPKARGKR